jgi:hypothetical protein
MAQARSSNFEAANDDEAIELFFERGLTDGLPVVPPTEARVARMMAACRSLKPTDIIGEVAPNYRPATVEKIAINAVMAGCRPDYLPVLVAGVRAICRSEFNLHGLQATTHFAAPLFIINGPIRKEIDINCSHNVFGQGWRANATIGRALRLIMVNLGGAKPGEIDKSTLGHPGKYTYCIGENEEQSPFEPLHVERGFDRAQSTITAFGAEAPHGISDHYTRDPSALLLSIGKSMGCLWNHKAYPIAADVVLVLSPEHAQDLGRAGFTRRKIRDFLFEKVRRPASELLKEDDGLELSPLAYKIAKQSGSEALVPKFISPDSISIVVAGSTAGRFSAAIPGWLFGDMGSVMVTEPINPI